MRRFSQRNSLVTLNEINITPLLDLAFVLLIIFIITRPMLEQSMDLNLPSVGRLQDKPQIDPRDVRVVEINPRGEVRLGGRTMDLRQLERELVQTFRSNPNLVVSIRGDKDTKFENVAQVTGICMRNGITKLSIKTVDK